MRFLFQDICANLIIWDPTRNCCKMLASCSSRLSFSKNQTTILSIQAKWHNESMAQGLTKLLQCFFQVLTVESRRTLLQISSGSHQLFARWMGKLAELWEWCCTSLSSRRRERGFVTRITQQNYLTYASSDLSVNVVESIGLHAKEGEETG